MTEYHIVKLYHILIVLLPHTYVVETRYPCAYTSYSMKYAVHVSKDPHISRYQHQTELNGAHSATLNHKKSFPLLMQDTTILDNTGNTRIFQMQLS
jgi:hypothetical protein